MIQIKYGKPKVVLSKKAVIRFKLNLWLKWYNTSPNSNFFKIVWFESDNILDLNQAIPHLDSSNTWWNYKNRFARLKKRTQDNMDQRSNLLSNEGT